MIGKIASSLRARIRLGDLPRVGLVLVLVFAALPFVTFAYTVITFPYQVGYREGPVLDEVLRLSRFENIYKTPTPSGPFTVTNYPPVFYLMQVPFAWVVGPALWYGRVISWLAALATAVLVGATVHTLTRDRVAAVTGSLVFVSIPYVTIWGPMDRPDFIALALTWGALFTISRWPEARWSLFATAALFVASAFTRQTSLLAGPLAAFALLVGLGHRRRAVLLAAVTAASCALVGLALDVATGGGFFFSVVLSNVNPFAIELLTSAARDMGEFMPILLACAVALFALEKAPGVRWFLLPYTIGAVGVTLTVLKVGSHVNYFLELSAALGACAGVLVAAARFRSAALGTVLTAGLVIQALLLALWWHKVWFPQLGAGINRVAIERVRDIVDGADGPVLLEEDMALLPLAGRPILIQPFEMKQLSDGGLWDQSVFVRSIEEKRYAVITMTQLFASQRWTREMRTAVATHYVPAESFFGLVVYRPAPAGPP